MPIFLTIHNLEFEQHISGEGSTQKCEEFPPKTEKILCTKIGLHILCLNKITGTRLQRVKLTQRMNFHLNQDSRWILPRTAMNEMASVHSLLMLSLICAVWTQSTARHHTPRAVNTQMSRGTE